MNEINPTELLQRIGYNLHAIRGALKQTLQGVASNIGVTHPVLSQVENGRYKTLQITLLVKLCNYYGVSLQQILSLELANVFPFNQNSHAADYKQNGHDWTKGYELCLKQVNNEIDYLKRQIEKLTEEQNRNRR